MVILKKYMHTEVLNKYCSITCTFYMITHVHCTYKCMYMYMYVFERTCTCTQGCGNIESAPHIQCTCTSIHTCILCSFNLKDIR